MHIGLKFDPEGLLPPFDDSLPTDLRVYGERELLERRSLTRATYSTQRFLCVDHSQLGAVIRPIPVANECSLQCEAWSEDLVWYCKQHGLELAKDPDTANAFALVREALVEVIQPYHSLWVAISELAWRCHIVLADHEDYDVSFSDPSIPFSIFISAPAVSVRRSVLRVAENLVHETMHLQLTLFERCCPLVDTTVSWAMYSPWKRQDRPTQGVLHGLYVFCVLRWMWRQFAETARNNTDRNFALRRINDIEKEVSEVRALEESPALTPAGRLFLHHLLRWP
jgi:hypothetical protein